MAPLKKIIASLEQWQRKNKKAEAVFFGAVWLMLSLLRALNQAKFSSNIFETLLDIGFYAWFIVLVGWSVLMLNPLLGEYLRRREAGESREEAMLFEAKHSTTGSVWLDAVIFFSVILAGVGVIFYFTR